MQSPTEKSSVPDHATGDVDSYPSQWFKDYWQLARMHKFPAGTMVLFFPGAWALVMASRSTTTTALQMLELHGLFFALSTVIHSAACVLNDICDIDFDRQVERTKNRPLASGRVSVRSAWIFFALLVALFMGLISVLKLQAILLGLAGLVIQAVYPLMKRVTDWPQAYLGIAMNWPFVVAWVAVHPYADWRYLAMALLAMGCWTIVYDTIYALQDKKDDPHAGVKSTAVLFGSWVKPILAVFSAAFVGTLAAVGWWNGQSWAFFVISILGSAAHLVWQLLTLDVDDAESCFQTFLSNGFVGLIIWIGAAVDCAIVIPF